ncbi:glycosyltransferase family 4 protein, partial [bacterium]|nr:glycosyltransferase family 4 protein [bacterium]
MYRILVINWQDITHPQAGGAEVHYHEIFKRLVERGHSVTVLCCHYPGAPKTEIIDGIQIVRSGGRNWFNFIVPSQYRKLSRSQPFDVVFDDINKIPFYTPLFVKEPLIAIVHHLFGQSIYKEAGFIGASYVYLAEKLVSKIYRSTPVAAVSPSTRDDLIGRGFQREQIELIYNGIDAAVYTPDPQLRADAPVIGYLGRIRRYKSVAHVLAALKEILPQIPDVRLLLVGDGEHLPEIRKEAVALGITGNVEFTGFVG